MILKIKNRCRTDTNKVAVIINNAYILYRARPINNVIIARYNNTSFSLRGTEENKKKFIDAFIACVCDYAISHGMLITGHLSKDCIIFDDLKKEDEK